MDKVNKFLSYVKWIGLILIAIGVFILIIKYSRGKSGQKENIEKKIKEAEAIQNKTEEDLKKINELHEEKKKIETEIEATNKRYVDAVEVLKSKPSTVSESYNKLKNIW